MHTLDDDRGMDTKLYDVREALGKYAQDQTDLHAGMAANAVDAYVNARGVPPALDIVDRHRLDAMRSNTSAKVTHALARIERQLRGQDAMAA